MSEEIKEILDNLKCKNDSYCCLHYKECEELLNYITNLQQENEELKKKQNPLQNIFAQVTNDQLLRNCGAMQQEVEELRTDNKRLKHNEKVYKSTNNKIYNLLCDIESLIMRKKYAIAIQLIHKTKKYLQSGDKE